MRGTKITAVLATTLVVAVSTASAPARAEVSGPSRIAADPGYAYVYAREAPVATPSAATTFPAPPNEDFVFRYAHDVSPEKRAVFEAAAGIWSSVLEVEVPITVGVALESFDEPDILGGAAPADLLANDPDFPAPDVWYVSALANQFLGRDADPTRPEIDVLISADYPFDEGVGTPVSPQRISLLTLALHELGHGLGHTTLAQLLPDRTGTIRHDGMPLTYDLLIRDQSGTRLVDLGPAALGRAMTERLLWIGPEGARADGGFLPELFAPGLFQSGSSVSHLDEATYGRGLMTPFIAPGELTTVIPPLTRAMMADFGWGVEASLRTEMLVTALSRDFLRRFPTPTELAFASGLLASGTTSQEIARAYGESAESLATLVDRHHRIALGRSATLVEQRSGTRQLRAGVPAATLLAGLLASDERFARSGGTLPGWVDGLYRDVLGRAADDAGRSAWAELAIAGSRAEAALRFVQSAEARARRVNGLYGRFLGRQPDAAGAAAWTEVIAGGHDLEAAVRMASSAEYVERSVHRFG